MGRLRTALGAKARAVLWAAVVDCCSGVGRNSIRLNSWTTLGNINFQSPPILNSRQQSVLPSKWIVCQSDVHSRQVDQGANQVEMRSSQVDQSASQVDKIARQEDLRLVQREETAGCPSLARRHGAACLEELRTPGAARIAARRPVCPLEFHLAPARSPTLASGLWHGALDTHRLVVNGVRQANPVVQCYGDREG